MLFLKEALFHRLYDTYHQDVFQFLIYLVRDRSVAEDLSHEVYVRVLKSYDNFQGKSSEKTWLFTIAKNVAIDYFRKMKVRRKHNFDSFEWENEKLVSPQKSLESNVIFNDELRQLLVGLEECTEEQKMVIILRYFQEMSIKETAAILNWTEAKVKTTQHRAIKTLREYMLKKEASQIES